MRAHVRLKQRIKKPKVHNVLDMAILWFVCIKAINHSSSGTVVLLLNIV
ncbi:MAG: hypothetical protein XE00_0203 [Desulfofundulus kuznetsovii]|nr:MAG: hypothetical protein XD84_1621 [Desulfotomaculum sp. 46_80]KUK85260.1 MAG: hypothetical protein XE00_0203 [Desulfofundulus kuznetsovii]